MHSFIIFINRHPQRRREDACGGAASAAGTLLQAVLVTDAAEQVVAALKPQFGRNKADANQQLRNIEQRIVKNKIKIVIL